MCCKELTPESQGLRTDTLMLHFSQRQRAAKRGANMEPHQLCSLGLPAAPAAPAAPGARHSAHSVICYSGLKQQNCYLSESNENIYS